MLKKFINAETTIANKILLDGDLSDTEVRVYFVIKMLSYKDGYCWATNHQLSKLLNKTSNAINLAILRLKRKKYIVVNTVKSRTPIRKIFTMQAWAELSYTNQIPQDCLHFDKDLPKQDFTFKEFKNFIVKNYPKAIFTLAQGNPLKYRSNIQFMITKTGYIHNNFTQKLLPKEEAFKMWQHLYDNRDFVIQTFVKFLKTGT